MDIELLREFITLTETLNYTKAADALHVTQPTLSKHIASMERELGCELFERDRRRVELTDVGNIFAAAAMQIVDTYDGAQARISAVKAQVPLKVVGVISDSTISSIISIAASFLDSEGHVPIVYNHTSNGDFIAQLMSDEADIAISYTDVNRLDDMGLGYAPLTRSQFVAIVNPDNPLARMKQVSIDDLRNYRLVRYADAYAANGWACIEAVCHDHGFTPRSRTVLGRTSMNYCATKLGPEDVNILQSSMSQLRYLSDFSRVCVLPVIDDDAVFKLYAVYKKDNYERVKPALDAYSQARRVIINHGKNNLLVGDE